MAPTRFDVLTSFRNYVDHVLPLYLSLPEDRKGYWYCMDQNIFTYVADRIGASRCLLGRTRDGALHPSPLIVAGYTDYAQVTDREIIFVEHGAGQTYCISPEMRVITSDLRWVRARDLVIGDKLIAFDENSFGKKIKEEEQFKGRQLRTADVLQITNLTKPCFKLYMEDGTELVSSEEHQWLKVNRETHEWLRTDKLQPASVFPKHSSKLVKLFSPWNEDKSWGAGYLAAAFDGEGCFHQKDRIGHGNRAMLSYAQNQNAMLEEVKKELSLRNYNYSIYPNNETDCLDLTILGGRSEVLRLLGSIRPRRLLSNMYPVSGVLVAKEKVAVLRSEFIGDQPVVGITTSTGTFIAEGFASHNCDANGFPDRHSSNAGGDGRERVKLFLCTNERVAEVSRKAYPNAEVLVWGCPRLAAMDPIAARQAAQMGTGEVSDVIVPPDQKTVGISAHWSNRYQNPETDWALPYFDEAIRKIVAENPPFRVLGHGHPRFEQWFADHWRRLGVEYVPNFEDLVKRINVYVIDNSSTLFEACALDIPVVIMNSPKYRKDVHHGMRFWEYADVGEQVDDPAELLPAIIRALEDPEKYRQRRLEIASILYPYSQGEGAAIAAQKLCEIWP